MTTEPTDAEIDEVTLDVLGYAALDKETNETARMIARAVLAKWGTPQPVVREPLTDGQAKEVLWNEHLRWMNAAGLDTEGMHPTGEWLDHWLFYVRAIERAHGITRKGGS